MFDNRGQCNDFPCKGADVIEAFVLAEIGEISEQLQASRVALELSDRLHDGVNDVLPLRFSWTYVCADNSMLA
jgi:hypothetical protein